MFKLKSLTLHNFQSIKDITVEMSKPGLYLISGYNTLGGDSNGSGKSTLLAGIAYALWGKTPAGLRTDEVKNWDSTEFCVELVLESQNQLYTIHRGSDKLELLIDGNVMKGRKRDMQDLINETFHSSDDVFFSSTLFTSNMSDYLTQMGDAAKKRLFKSIMRLEKLDAAYDKTKTQYAFNTARAAELEQEISLNRDMLAASEAELNVLKNQFMEYESSRQNRLDELSYPVEKPKDTDTPFLLKAKRAAVQELEANKEQKLQEANDLNGYINRLYEKIGEVGGSITTTEGQLSESRRREGSAICDVCGSVLTGSKLNERISELERTKEDLVRRKLELESEMDRKLGVIRGIEDFTDAVLRQKEELISLERQEEKEELARQIYKNAVEDNKKRRKEIQSERNPYEKLIEGIAVDRGMRINKLINLEEQFKIITKQIDNLSFLKTVFSREGVAAQIIESSFGSIQSLANRYLSKICSEDLFVKIVPQRELKSKAMKEEIDIFIVNKSKPDRRIPYAALSGGQQQRVNIALLMALYKFCRNLGINEFDFIILDEVLDLSLAAKGQSDVVSLLRDLLQEVGQIFVVSHKEAISQDFDYEIQLRREDDGVTRIV